MKKLKYSMKESIIIDKRKKNLTKVEQIPFIVLLINQIFIKTRSLNFNVPYSFNNFSLI